jgi:hypothetical protein
MVVYVSNKDVRNVPSRALIARVILAYRDTDVNSVDQTGDGHYLDIRPTPQSLRYALRLRGGGSPRSVPEGWGQDPLCC